MKFTNALSTSLSGSTIVTFTAAAILMSLGCANGDEAGAPDAASEREASQTEGDASTCQLFDYENYAPESDAELRRHVMPIFNRACAFSGCHSLAERKNAGDLALGSLEEVDDREPTHVRESLLLPAQIEPSVSLVVPGEPERSFLMNKIQGNLECANLPCGERCGLPMPQPNPPLSKDDVERIRAWIKLGALDN